MKVVHITSDNSGGAGLAALRLNEALVKSGIDSKILCKRKTSPSKNVIEYQPSFWNKIVAYLILKLKKNRFTKRFFKNSFDLVYCSQSLYDLSKHPLVQQADIINLHWIGGTVNYKKLFQGIKKPIVWTLHDMNPFLGEAQFMIHLENKDKETIEREKRIQKLKQKFIRKHENITIVNLCEWMKKYSSASETFHDVRHVIIPNSLDTDIFKPYDKHLIREILGLPKQANIFMFGCQNHSVPRKGLHILLEAIKLRNNPEDIFITVGEAVNIKVDSKIIDFGVIHDERLMAMLYSSADAFLLPSTEDNLPNTMLESLCCGTPVITFTNGGMTDIIEDGQNGYLIKPSDGKHLAAALEKFIKNKNNFDRKTISEKARKMFAPTVQASNYISLYESILAH